MRNKSFTAILLIMAATTVGCSRQGQPTNQLTLGDTVPAKDFEPRDSVDSLAPENTSHDLESTFIFLADAATTMEVKLMPSLRDTIFEKDDAIQIHGNLVEGDTINVVFGHNEHGERTLLDVQKKVKPAPKPDPNDKSKPTTGMPTTGNEPQNANH